nr:MAG TPA: hypothetical protein [Caudoviricetes sp.]
MVAQASARTRPPGPEKPIRVESLVLREPGARKGVGTGL